MCTIENMVIRLKRLLYFPVASYFRFWAKIQLSKWNPTVIVITGSSGKTTLLHLIASQLLHSAKYSHHANSSFGIPFDILGLSRKTLFRSEWFLLFLSAPFRAWKTPWKEQIYIVETDCDRPGEGKFLAQLLRPSVTLWLNASRTHSMNYDVLVEKKRFKTVEEAIAHEFGYFANMTQHLVIVNSDSPFIEGTLAHVQTRVIQITKKLFLRSYRLEKEKTVFQLKNHIISFPFLLPEETYSSLCMVIELLTYLHKPIDITFQKFSLPPGRSSLFHGIRETTIIDSSYNATLDGMRAMLHILHLYPAQKKWAVLGDMIEQGREEKEEHEKLADLIIQSTVNQVILVGPRVSKYTYPILKKRLPQLPVAMYEKPDEALRVLIDILPEKTTILFKGARFLEGIIEKLLINTRDVQKLCRREKIWYIRRKQWGL